MTQQVDRERRDELLDKLKEAVDEWADKEEERIEAEVKFLKSVLRGRTGSERLSRSNTTEASVLLSTDLDAFLTGSS
jgi:cell division septum initiation protein DivIVA